MPHIHVLVLSRNYPNPVIPTLGIWVHRLVEAAAPFAQQTVVAPVPYVPPLIAPRQYRRFREIPYYRSEAHGDVWHPRVPTGPGNTLHGVEAHFNYYFLRGLVDRLHRERGFDLIHAHFIYPDAVVAAQLGRRLNLPVITTEHAMWLPWLQRHPYVRAQVRHALPDIRLVTTVSRSLEATVRAVHSRVETAYLPNVLDDRTFRAPEPGETWDPDQLLFVGVNRQVKGLDVLVRALGLLVRDRRSLRLVVVGKPFYAQYRRDTQKVRDLVADMGLASKVEFVGHRPPEEVASYMRRSAMLVVPSRRETFSSVTVEALASGTPVVATRCGGPEEILTDRSGILVPTDDPPALADAILQMLDRRPAIDRAVLRREVVERFGWGAATARSQHLYRSLLECDPPAAELRTSR